MMKDIDAGKPLAFDEQVLQRVYDDDTYAERLETNTRAALEEVVGPLPAGVEYRLVRDTETVKYVHIPQLPKSYEVTDADLLNAQGGTSPWLTHTVVITVYGSPQISGALTLDD